MGTRVYVEVISKHRHLSLGGAWERPPWKSGLSLSPPQKGQMSRNYFKRLQWVNYFRVQVPPSWFSCATPHSHEGRAMSDQCGNIFASSNDLKTHIDTMHCFRVQLSHPLPPACPWRPDPVQISLQIGEHATSSLQCTTVPCGPACCYHGRGKVFFLVARPISTFMLRAKKYQCLILQQ